MEAQSLIAFDTDHIKGYVFGTRRLKEIRGASSLLDRLNRVETVQKAEELNAKKIYANGGSALFVIDSVNAVKLGQAVQKLYRDRTGGGASITYAIQDIPASYNTQNLMEEKMPEVLKLVRWRLREARNNLEGDRVLNYIALPSHPFFSPCNSCGTAYAEETRSDPDDTEDTEGSYCRICLEKRDEDIDVKTSISDMIHDAREGRFSDKTLWGRILQVLCKQPGSERKTYDLSATPKRPRDFNFFNQFTRGKEYLGLIYADANGMGKAIEKLQTLREVQEFAKEVDEAIFNAMGYAINEHLPVQCGFFPFDILLVGGDDVVIVTPAAKALQVASTIAEQFHRFTSQKYTLSVGVILAPVKYPFGLQQALADETLKAAKKSGSSSSDSQQEQTRINFVVVTGSTSLNYQSIYQELQRKKLPYGNDDEFYATLRPYTLSQLKELLTALNKASKQRLGRTKLHQLREAILKLNRTTSILEALSLLRNWKSEEKAFIKQLVDRFDTRSAESKKKDGITFPWFLDGKFTYRTPLLDFIELYDFVSSEERA